MKLVGGGVLGRHLYAWGDGLYRAALPSLDLEQLDRRTFTAGGVLFDGLALQHGDELVDWRDGRTERIDTSAAVVDMREASLLGHRGLLVVHRGMQLRLYERPEGTATRWPYRELYSFYTASEQGGLLIHDVDGDNKPDLICGNYWVQSPSDFDLPWRLFAINLYHETPLAASARLAMLNGQLLWLESKAADGRAMWLTPPPDPKQLWTATPAGARFDHPRGILVAREQVWVGDRRRIITLPDRIERASGYATEALVEADGRIVSLGPEGLRIVL